ncbi:MAG TPA: SRPBCC domain-containing protein [Bacteroidia bacterium]|nr:SRPBCC domain-containing protein [Bacteroidia bacterium]
MSNTKELTITRVLNAPRELVWQAWTEQKHIEKWWGPKGFTNPICEWDACVKGHILIHMKAPDGMHYPMNGVFSEIIKPSKIAFTSAALDKDGGHLFDIVNTINFIEEGNKTKLLMHFTFTNIIPSAVHNIEGASTGWNMSIDKLEVLLETLKH